MTSTASDDARFWDRSSRKYARSAIADQAGYDRTLARTRDLLKPTDRVLELGCGTGTTALKLAPAVRTYLATDISPGMIAIAEEKRAAEPVEWPAFRAATADGLAEEGGEAFDAVLGFNYLHLVRDLDATLKAVHDLLGPGGLFVSKTACVGDMNPVFRLLLPVMRALGKAPHVTLLGVEALKARLVAAGFEIVAVENHATKGGEARPYIVARRR